LALDSAAVRITLFRNFLQRRTAHGDRKKRMTATGDEAARTTAWLAALEARHLAMFSPAEIARALRALSSWYVERRAGLAEGRALDTAGKRAAFALFYAPMHWLTVQYVVRALPAESLAVSLVLDLGCGTGAAGAAWALECQARVKGTDRHPWAVAEANWTYRQLGLQGRAVTGDLLRAPLAGGRGTGVLAAWAVNELGDTARDALFERMRRAHARGASVLVVEPIARRVTPWWGAWADRFVADGGREDEWRFPAVLPDRQRALAQAAGLRPTALTARTLLLPAPP
jgi:SAM-dependent methyltransferase